MNSYSYFSENSTLADVNDLKQSNDVRRLLEENIQSTSKPCDLDKVKLGKSEICQALISIDGSENYSTGHTVGVKSVRDSMIWLPQFLLGLGIDDNEVHNVMTSLDLASGIPNLNYDWYIDDVFDECPLDTDPDKIEIADDF